MVQDFDPTYEKFKGQGKDIRLPDGRVVKRNREGGKGEPSKDVGSLYPFMPKCTQMLFDLPKLQVNPLERICAVFGAEYGGYIELAAVGDENYNPTIGTSRGASIPNRTITDACMVYDRINYTSNYLFMNVFSHFAYIDQRKGRKPYVRNDAEDSQLAGMVIQSMAQEQSIKRKALMNRLFCDCVPGDVPAMTDGNTKSDGTGSVVTDDSYSVEGWAGKVIEMSSEVSGLAVPKLEVGKKAQGISATAALTLAEEVINVITYGKYLSNYYVPGNRRLDKFTTPVLVMEQAVLNALEKVFVVGDVGGGTAEIPRSFNTGWREYVKANSGVSVLTTDIFEDLPAGDYDGQRLLCALVEPDHFKDFVYQDDMDSDKCIQPRGIVYDYQRVEALGIDVRRPSCVFTVNVA